MTVRQGATLSVRIERAWARLAGWSYGGPQFPDLAPGMPAVLSRVVVPGIGKIDCSSATAWTVCHAYPRAHEVHPRLYADLQVQEQPDGTIDPWSPIRAVELAYIGSRAPVVATPGVWYIAQTWRNLDAAGRYVSPAEARKRGVAPSTGHARLFVVEGGNRLRVLESSQSYGGVREVIVRSTTAFGGTTQVAALGGG